MSVPNGFLDRLRLGSGFKEQDRPVVVEALASLPKHLAHWEPDMVQIELRVHERGGDEQRVTLEVRLPGWPTLVASAEGRDLDRALREARKELVRQLEDQKDLHRPSKGKARRPSG